jgi:AraC-like DNA-binding protein
MICARYVVAQAKRLIRMNPTWTVKQVGFHIGFAESSSFYRYFRRVAGITVKDYKSQFPHAD